MRKRMYLQLFEDGAGAGSGGQGGNAGAGNGGQGSAGGSSGSHGNGAYTYEQLEEIASARAEKSERAANQPNATKLQQDLDDANKKIQQMENEKVLAGKGVKSEDLDYVMFKVSKLVDDKTTFEKAAEKYLKENPRYMGGSTYRVSTSTGSESNGSGGGLNASINDKIRAAARR